MKELKKLKFIIPGIPFSKQSMRVAIRGNHIHKYQKKELVQAELTVKYIIISQLPKGFKPFIGPVFVERIDYIFPMLKSFSKKKRKQFNPIYKTTKPDLGDNLNKGLFDAMEGVVFLNDSQICQVNSIRKVYGEKPRIEISIIGEVK